MPKQSDNIKVICRVRPLNKNELGRGEKECTTVNGNQVSVSSRPDKKYNFDAVIPPSATQEQVYEIAARHVLDDVLQGFNGTIFAYGQTASGKTFTMEGALTDKKNKGIIPRLILEVFKYIEDTPGWDFTIQVSYFEIYNEKIRDLLNPKAGDNLPISEDRKRRPYVKNLRDESVATPQEVMRYIESGKKNRHIGTTNMNEHSSRSHSVFVMNIGQENKDSGEKRKGRLYLVDLAGSEKVGKTGATGQTLDEAKNINKSLSCLGNVISALLEKGKSHVPYRDSKLTRILQDSLGGNSKTTMIICCSPAKMNEGETQSTLLFGTRVKTIKNSVSANVERSPDEWKRLYNTQMKKVATIKELALKLCAETKMRRKGKEPPANKQIDIELLEKMLNNLDTQAADGAIDNVGAENLEQARDKERLKNKLSKLSLAAAKEREKAAAAKAAKLAEKEKALAEKKKAADKTAKEKEAAAKRTAAAKKAKAAQEEGGATKNVKDPKDQSAKLKKAAEANDIPEDVLAVLQAEIELKTQELQDERTKLRRELDEKDDEIHELSQKIKTYEGQTGQHQEGLKGAMRGQRNAMAQISDLQAQIEQHKERNNKLNAHMQEANREAEAARGELAARDDEIRENKQKLANLKNQAQSCLEALEAAKAELASSDEKNGERLVRICEELSVIGKTMVGEKNAHHFDYRKPDPKRIKECYACIRSLLAKNKHFAALVNRKMSELEKELQDTKENADARDGAAAENAMLLQQAKERMEELNDRNKELEQQKNDLEEKIAKRDAMIMKLGGAENIGDDEELDPDLMMIRDEHLKQLKGAENKEKEQREKYEQASKERDDLKRELQRLKEKMEQMRIDHAREKQELKNEADFIAMHGGAGMGADMINNDLQLEKERLNKIKMGMTDKFKAEVKRMQNSRPSGAAGEGEGEKAKGKKEETPPKGSDAKEGDDEGFEEEGKEGETPAAGGAAGKGGKGGEGEAAGEDGVDPLLLEEDEGGLYPVGSPAKKQIMFLESSLDEVTRQVRELTRENRKLKTQLGEMEGQVDHFQKRQSFMTSQMRDDQEDAIRQRDELRDEIDKHRARSMVRKSSIKKSITAESLKRSSNLDADDEYGLGAEKSFDEGGSKGGDGGSFDEDKSNDADDEAPKGQSASKGNSGSMGQSGGTLGQTGSLGQFGSMDKSASMEKKSSDKDEAWKRSKSSVTM